ncbi:MAG TPA: cation:proton antiporter [Micropepsaceae bacterium]|nr:cation:proton antiporter [Micropepsaceae bacterium]
MSEPVHAVTGAILGVLGAVSLLGVGSMLVPAAKRVAVPYSVLLAVLGAGIGAILASGSVFAGISGDILSGIRNISPDSESLLYLFLPPLLFAGGLTIDARRLFDDVWPVMLLAIVAVVLCCLAVGYALHIALSISLLTALVLGAIVSPTDTAAVLSIFRDIGAPRRLSVIVEGESLFNDAAAIALYVVLLQLLITGAEGGVFEVAIEFMIAMLGGIIIGYGLGRTFGWLVPLARGFMVTELTLSVALAYLSFIIAQHYAGASGIVAVVAAAITVSTTARTRLTPGTWEALLAIWRQLDFWATLLIFVLAAMKFPDAISQLSMSDVNGIIVVFIAALVARGFSLYGLMPVLAFARLAGPINFRYKTVLWWGGVRGAVTAALALSVADTELIDPETRRYIFVVAVGFVLATLFVNAITLRPLMKLLRLDKLDERERMVKNRVLALSRARVEREVAEAAKRLGLERAIQEQSSDEDARFRAELGPDDRLMVGLISACNRETELCIDYLQRGLADREVVDTMLAYTGRLLDSTLARGEKGYVEASRRNHQVTWRFRAALWLHREMQIEGPLAGEIAARFEIMLIKDRILADIKDFAANQLKPMIGDDAYARLEVILANRSASIHATHSALELQYPEYARLIRQRLVERLSLAIEESEYRVQLDQSLISAEVFEELENDRLRRMKALSHRPKLDLGLELTEMIAKVPLFTGVSRESIDRIAKLLRPQLHVQGEQIIKAGETGSEMYFIVSGEVDVMIRPHPVRLKRGDFFGEVALIKAQPRNADVVAATYCEVLTLRRRDLASLFRQYPGLEAHIARKAEERRGSEDVKPKS